MYFVVASCVSLGLVFVVLCNELSCWIEDLRVARHLCCCCVPIIDGEVEAGSRAAGRDEAITVADLGFGRSAVKKNSVLKKTMCQTSTHFRP